MRSDDNEMFRTKEEAEASAEQDLQFQDFYNHSVIWAGYIKKKTGITGAWTKRYAHIINTGKSNVGKIFISPQIPEGNYWGTIKLNQYKEYEYLKNKIKFKENTVTFNRANSSKELSIIVIEEEELDELKNTLDSDADAAQVAKNPIKSTI